MSENKQSFMDSKTIIAVVLVGLSWIAWQTHMKKKYPDMYNPKPTAEIEQSKESKVKEGLQEVRSEQQAQDATEKRDEIAEAQEDISESFVSYKSENLSFEISSLGMGLKNITLNKYKDRQKKPMVIGKSTAQFKPFETNVIGRRSPLPFAISQLSENEFVGKAQSGQARIEKRMVVNPQNYTIETNIYVSNVADDAHFTGLVTYISEKIKKDKDNTFFLPSFEHEEAFVLHDGEEDRVMVTDEDTVESFDKVSVAAVGSQYFTLAIKDESDVMPEVKAVVDAKNSTVFANLRHNILSRTKDYKVTYTAFAGPKSYELLEAVGGEMTNVINFGWFSSLATYILKLMKLFYGFIGNWGVAIILLTILVRLVVLPFNIMSFKSMKKMQDIQPRLKAIREKHKEDRERMNQETMALMRENKVNPLGGCLPMLLQFPVFIALYQVLGQSIELYQAPFVFWINDLSLKDHFYVLPVLMGVTMYFQQKLTPSTMDPAQQRIFKLMPIIFALFMISLPSGLTLYIFISALFAVVQQYFFMNPRKS